MIPADGRDPRTGPLSGSADDPDHDPIISATLAARLFAASPHALGGMILRGGSPARDALVAALEQVLPCRRLPGHVDAERLDGGIDIGASLAAGRPVETAGLLSDAAGGVLIVPMAERIDDAIAGRLAQALDERTIAVILLDDGIEADDAPPASLTERVAFICDLTASRARGPVDWLRGEAPSETGASETGAHPSDLPMPDAGLSALATTAYALGIGPIRPLLFATAAARTHAALRGSVEIESMDLEAAARLVLAPRATRIPDPVDAPDEPSDENEPPPESEPPPPDPSPDPSSEEADKNSEPGKQTLDEQMVEAAAASIPADLLTRLSEGKPPRRGAGGGSGRKRKSGLRGKPLGARAGMPRGGARLALIDTLRAAVPWQAIRRRESGSDDHAPIIMRKGDLRVRRFEERAARVTIFAVDASGSAAAARLAEAKGAVELMLSQAYVTRSQVALIAFRGNGAQLLLPPTRSLTRARRALGEIPGGGGTPLAIGLDAARETAQAVAARGRTPSIVVLTDGRANIDADGSPGRKQAGEDANAAARALAREGYDALVIDISARPGREGAQLAEAMNARYLALPRADAQALHRAVSAISSEKAGSQGVGT